MADASCSYARNVRGNKEPVPLVFRFIKKGKKKKKKRKGEKKILGSVTAHLYVSVSLFDEKERKREREREKKKILFSSARYYYHVSASGIQLKGGTESNVFESGGGREEGIKEGA